MSTPVLPGPAAAQEIDIMETSVKLIRFLRKHILWVIIFPVLGLVGGFLSNMAKGPVYGAELMLRSRVLTEIEMKFLVSNFERSRYPGLSKKDRRAVAGVHVEVKKQELYTFGTVTFESTDTTVFKKFSTALVKHIENEPAVQATTKNTNDVNTALINEYTATIRKADLLLDQRDIDPTLAYKNYRNIPDVTLLHERRRELEIARRDSSALVIVSDFAPQELSIEKAKALIIGFTIGAFCAGILLFIIHFVEYYRKTSDIPS
jgi:hypothetical protein